VALNPNPNPDRPTLLFDLDGVCCNLLKKWLAVYNQEHNDNVRYEDLDRFSWDHLAKGGKKIYQYLSRPGFFADLEPIPGCQAALERLGRRCELVVVTASPKAAMADKQRWVEKHLPMVPKDNVVITRRKDLVSGTFMLDDAPKNLANHPAIRLLFDAPYNRDFHDAYRVHNWDEVEATVNRLLDQIERGERPPQKPA
jgi:5'-nucleotidase